jgi:beta-lactam-binding protein with PASTA domain
MALFLLALLLFAGCGSQLSPQQPQTDTSMSTPINKLTDAPTATSTATTTTDILETEPVQPTMPNVIGLNYRDAEATLESLDIVSEKTPNPIPTESLHEIVKATTPGAGEPRETGQPVVMVVYVFQTK